MGLNLFISLSLWLSGIPDAPDPAPQWAPAFPEVVVAGFDAHCYRCHSGEKVKGGSDDGDRSSDSDSGDESGSDSKNAGGGARTKRMERVETKVMKATIVPPRRMSFPWRRRGGRSSGPRRWQRPGTQRLRLDGYGGAPWPLLVTCSKRCDRCPSPHSQLKLG